MRKLLLGLLLLYPIAGLAQVSAPSIILVGSAPSGSCSSNLPDEQVASLGTLYSCQSGTWTLIGGGGNANFPSTPGVVYNTSTSAARNAVPGDFPALVGIYTGSYSSGTTYKFTIRITEFP